MLSTGVSREHILFLRQSKVKSLGEIGEFFQSNGTEEVELVPVSKIKGLNRGTPGFSWLDHAEMIAGNLSPSSFQSFQQRLEETSLESFREWLKSESFLETNDVVTFNYYAECDEYYAYEGNHRTLWAKLVDAKYIKAKVNKYHYNSAKHSNYKKNYEKYANEVKNSDQHFRELLDICNLELKFNNNKVERNQIGYEDFQFSTYNSPHLNDKYRINYNSKVTIHAYFKMLKQQRALLINIMDRYFMSLKIPKKWRGRFLDFCYSRSTKYYHEFYILKVLNNKNWSPKCDLNEWRNIKQKIEA